MSSSDVFCVPSPVVYCAVSFLGGRPHTFARPPLSRNTWPCSASRDAVFARMQKWQGQSWVGEHTALHAQRCGHLAARDS